LISSFGSTPGMIFRMRGIEPSSLAIVMPGLDPGIHPLRKKASCEEVGLPGQARQ
jgi:hypothetical protein